MHLREGNLRRIQWCSPANGGSHGSRRSGRRASSDSVAKSSGSEATDQAAMSPSDGVSENDDQPKKAVQQGKTKETGSDTSDSSSKQSGDLERRQDPLKKVKRNPFDLRRTMINPSNAVEMEEPPSADQEDSSSYSELRRLEELSSDIIGTSSGSMTSSHS